ncbi:hypothetical protein [Mesorhizobium sp. M0571]|uniref:hypothetical protein n=1 Tax=Mesorhizobium sp. M0571 TaxID=2956960 RepID=UPI0033375E68
MANQTTLNLTQLLLAEKEEKRQLYNRYKELERSRDHFRDCAVSADNLRDQIRVLTGENSKLDQMVGKLLDENLGLKQDNEMLRMPQLFVPTS